MSVRVKIYGAGSSGNHLAQACRRKGWEVSVVDSSPASLVRMRDEIYPSRYGAWDPTIRLYKNGEEPKGGFDAVFIATPPDVRLDIALKVLYEEHPRVMLLEKPLCSLGAFNTLPGFLDIFKGFPDVAVCVGYNHALGKNTKAVENVLSSGALGEIRTIDVEFRDHWELFWATHPWLSGPEDSYLGYTERGGGALGEHSHAIHLWLHFAKLSGFGRAQEVSAFLDFGGGALQHDRIASLNIRTDSGKQGRVIQDVVTRPPRKWARIQGEHGFIEWHCGIEPNKDRVHYQIKGDEAVITDIHKTRPDEFFVEIEHIESLLLGKIPASESPISLESGIRTMKIIDAAHRSHVQKKSIAEVI